MSKREAGQWLFCWKKPGTTAKEYGVRIHDILPNGVIVAEVNPGDYELESEEDLEGYDHEPRCTGWDWVVPDDGKPNPADASQYVILRQDLRDNPMQRYKVIFFAPGQPEEADCLIGAFSCEAEAEAEAARFTESLQKLLDAIRA